MTLLFRLPPCLCAFLRPLCLVPEVFRSLAITKLGKRAPVAATDYRIVDPNTGAGHALAISEAGLPLLPGAIAFASQALQGSALSPFELL